jgi:PAS domain S-box-containing protein
VSREVRTVDDGDRDSETITRDPHWYRYLYDAIPDAVLVVDHRGHYVDANQAASALLGYSVAEFLELHISAVSAHAPAELAEAHAQVIQDGTWAGNGTFRHKDGSLVPIAARVVELITPTATFYVGMFRTQTPDAD